MSLRTLLTLSLAMPAIAVNLFVASYSGNITVLQLTSDNDNDNDSYDLRQIRTENTHTPNPSWLLHDSENTVLYCSDDDDANINEYGHLSAFTYSDDGVMSKVPGELSTPRGGVSTTFYNSGQAMAMAH